MKPKNSKLSAILLALFVTLFTLSGCSEAVNAGYESFSENFAEGFTDSINEALSDNTDEVSANSSNEALSDNTDEVSTNSSNEALPANTDEVLANSSNEALPDNTDEVSATESSALDEGGYYYSLEDVILYLDEYKHLPPNYIDKKAAKQLGWNGGPVSKYLAGGAIGGDKFGNYEGLLPSSKGIKYTECDIDTNGKNGRGAKRLIFSNEPRYYYTEDHYESFTEYVVEDGKIKAAE